MGLEIIKQIRCDFEECNEIFPVGNEDTFFIAGIIESKKAGWVVVPSYPRSKHFCPKCNATGLKNG